MKQVKYPTARPFTLKEVHSRIVNAQKDKAITYVGLFLKVKRDVSNGILEVVGNRKKGKKAKGRPQVLYSVTAKGKVATVPAPKVKTVKVAKAKAPKVEVVATQQKVVEQ